MSDPERFQQMMAESAKQAMDHPLDLDQPVGWSCNCSGRCCFGTDVLIYPQDVWGLVHAPEAQRARFDIQTSHDLFRDRRGGSYLSIYLGQHSEMPVASIKHRALGEGRQACPFLVPAPPRKSYTKRGRIALTVDGKPKMLCGVHRGGGRGSAAATPLDGSLRMIAMRSAQTVRRFMSITEISVARAIKTSTAKGQR